MSPSVSRVFEKVFLGYYLVYSFYFLYWINLVNGEFYLIDFLGVAPSLIFWTLLLCFYQISRRNIIIAKAVVFLLILVHAFLVFVIFYFFTDPEERHANRIHEILAYIGIGLSLIVLITGKRWIPAPENDE
jgi:hypothetical protein